jgi:alpha-N-acetylglucosaminidase
MWSGDEEDVQPLWYDIAEVFRAWKLLTDTAKRFEKETMPETLMYDIVNVGREYLAKVSNAKFSALANATSAAAVAKAGADLNEISDDVDELLCTDFGFRASWWIDAAVKLGTTADEKRSLEWAARAQPTTWLPACDEKSWPTPSGNVSNQVTGTCGTRSDLADYSNKQWGGLIKNFYSPRQQCYVQLVAQRGLPVSTADADYNKCLDKVAWDFQHDFGAKQLPLCPKSGDATTISTALQAKYSPKAIAMFKSTSSE